MVDRRLYFDEIYIIESLDGDQRTGRELYEDLLLMAVAATPPRPVNYKPLTTRQEFLALLRLIADDAKREGHSPILLCAAVPRCNSAPTLPSVYIRRVIEVFFRPRSLGRLA